MTAEMQFTKSVGQSSSTESPKTTADAHMQPIFSVIVVNWNTCDYLQECLQSILNEPGIRILSDEPPNIPARRTETNLPVYQSTLLPIEIIVVDNASTDESVAMMHSRFPQVRLIVNEQNLGFAAANNQAIDQAQAEALLRQSFGVTRFGDPEDIAALATFVVSERGKLLHGSLLDIDGGLTKTI